MNEQAFSFDCGGDSLVGVVHLPSAPSSVGVVVVVGGPQYRAGSHRQFVQLGRALCGAGYPVLRFDVRGMGDSTGEPRDFEHIGADIGAALDALQARAPAVRSVILWGLCDGASAALLYLGATGDERVAGLALLNPWIRTPASQARTRLRHYYLRRLAAREFWSKLFAGRVAVGTALAETGRALRDSGRLDAPPYPLRMARAWSSFAGPRLLMLSEFDHTAREFETYAAQEPAWREALAARPARRVAIAGADHTCSHPDAGRSVEYETIAWLRECGAGRQGLGVAR